MLNLVFADRNYKKKEIKIKEVEKEKLDLVEENKE
jgi:hypothetical protein